MTPRVPWSSMKSSLTHCAASVSASFFIGSSRTSAMALSILVVRNRPASLTYREIDGPVTLRFERNARA